MRAYVQCRAYIQHSTTLRAQDKRLSLSGMDTVKDNSGFTFHSWCPWFAKIKIFDLGSAKTLREYSSSFHEAIFVFSQDAAHGYRHTS